ncbi:flagellar export chaperone FliS [Sulfurimonas sp. SWIR-19]|uniref:flagellar export chaperone FliS n=1 Tax=Sulfurimonas sp. SWIR-19 TaxID=2878390 RepID=UPI001CF4B334|nr:flagellar export chaperone FliS [Sulfurimonas sp. SWIR-19]UCN00495.1 flagellar export chaperone FliS [Sulfurimonas sp. SWIR-19]
MYSNAAYNIYNQNNVNIESPEKLIEMMYEGVLRFNAQAKKAILDEDNVKKVYWVNRAISVIVELIAVLDKSQGDVAVYLDGLYNYQVQLLSYANIENNTEKIDEVSNVFKGLLAGWRETTDVAH